MVGHAGTILHWNGSAWSSVSSGTTVELHGIWGSGANDVWVVGHAGTVLHWNGSAWSGVTSGTTADLSSTWGSRANDVWAVGSPTEILHWNGTAWSSLGGGVLRRNPALERHRLVELPDFCGATIRRALGEQPE